jgi:hypothetical protein
VLDEEIKAELARRGLTFETWAAQIRAQAQAMVEKNRRAGPPDAGVDASQRRK